MPVRRMGAGNRRKTLRTVTVVYGVVAVGWNPPLTGDEDVESSLAPLPYWFVYAGNIPDTDVWKVITQSLDKSALSPRLNDFADLLPRR
jgi:hypothetical protein